MIAHFILMEKRRQKKNLLFFAAVCGLALLLTLGPSQTFANNTGGGYTGPGPDIVTVAQAKEMRDDKQVALKGYIIQSLGDNNYLFKDSTGAITVEISQKHWQGLTIGPEDLVELRGEVDKDWSSVEIEVERIIKR